MSLEGNVTISKEEYLRLLKSEEKLSLLEAGGVDNWDWYSESLFPDCDESGNGEDYDQACERLEEKVKRM